MKYIRTKDGIIDTSPFYNIIEADDVNVTQADGYNVLILGKDVIKQADTIEELIQIGDIVFYWQPSDDKEHCSLMVYDSNIHIMKYNAITKLLIPVGEDYKCVAKGYPSFDLIKGRKYLISKGELELL